MTRDEKEVVSALRKVLADKVGRERYTLWFGRTRFTWDGTRLVLYVHNTFYLDWIRTMFRDAIEETCECVLGKVPEISYELFDSTQLTEEDIPQPEPADPGQTRTRKPSAKRHSPPAKTQVALKADPIPSWEELPLFAQAWQSGKNGSNQTPCPRLSPTVAVSAGSHGVSPPEGAIAQAIGDSGNTPRSDLGGQDHEGPPRTGSEPLAPVGDTESQAMDPADPYSEEIVYLRVVGPGDKTEDRVEGIDRQSSGPRCNGSSKSITGLLKTASERPRDNCGQEDPAPGQRRFADLEAFVVGDCNRLAYAAAETVSRSLGTYSPLLIHGPSGVGKTHLLEGIWKAVKRRNPRVAALYLSAEQFTSAYVEALRSEGVPAFRQKYRGVQLLLLDDLHFFAGKRQTQIELLYTLDTLLKNGCQIVCAADRPPAELRELTPELRSRLEGGIVCRIDPPDLATRRKIVEKFCQTMNFTLPADLQEWVAESFSRSVRQLLGALRRLEAAFHALRRPVDRALASEILGDMLPEGTKQVTLADIEREVCRTFALPEGALQSGRKDRQITYPRMLAMWLARKCTRANLSEIGRFFGKRSHATVISAQKRVEEWLSTGCRIPLAWGERSVQEALQEIERRLRAG